MKQKLTLESLATLDDGRFGISVQRDINAISHDLSVRPGVKKARTLTITVKLTPITDEDGQLAGVDMVPDVKKSIPSTKGFTTSARRNAEGELVFNDASPDDPDQTTLDEIGPETADQAND